MSDQLISNMPSEIRGRWCEMKRDLVVGEFAEHLASARRISDPELLSRIAYLKTADYTIAAPLTLGACLAGAAHLSEAFTTFGAAVGEAFQIQDDILDCTQDSATTGKTTGGDQKLLKATTLLGVLSKIRSRTGNQASIDPQAISTLMRDPQVRVEVDQWMEGLIRRAEDSLAQAGIPGHVELCLRELAESLTHRDA